MTHSLKGRKITWHGLVTDLLDYLWNPFTSVQMPLNFRDTAIAFHSHDDTSLRRSYWLFKTLASPALVQMGKGVTLWALQWRLPIKSIIRATVFKQFCGGETVLDCKPVAQRNWALGVGSILDYSVEGQTDQKAYDHTTDMTLQTLAMAANEPGIPLGVFKVTGLADTGMLEKVSRGEALSTSESEAWERAQARVDRICHYAHQVGVPVMLDAEETWIQDAIDRLAYQAMARYNQEKVIVFNTIQCYRTGRLEALNQALENAQKGGYGLGIKFVRGAYMEKERERAQKKGLPSPIQPTKEATDAEFNACVVRMISALGRPEDGQKLACMIGSHNEESAALAADWLTAQGWTPETAPVWFAQLYGMSDHISFVMAHHGFRVAKYLPFGPIDAVMPYLFRRAEENTSVKGQTGRELGLIQTERARRSAAKRSK